MCKCIDEHKSKLHNAIIVAKALSKLVEDDIRIYTVPHTVFGVIYECEPVLLKIHIDSEIAIIKFDHDKSKKE